MPLTLDHLRALDGTYLSTTLLPAECTSGIQSEIKAEGHLLYLTNAMCRVVKRGGKSFLEFHDIFIGRMEGDRWYDPKGSVIPERSFATIAMNFAAIRNATDWDLSRHVVCLNEDQLSTLPVGELDENTVGEGTPVADPPQIKPEDRKICDVNYKSTARKTHFTVLDAMKNIQRSVTGTQIVLGASGIPVDSIPIKSGASSEEEADSDEYFDAQETDGTRSPAAASARAHSPDPDAPASSSAPSGASAMSGSLPVSSHSSVSSASESRVSKQALIDLLAALGKKLDPLGKIIADLESKLPQVQREGQEKVEISTGSEDTLLNLARRLENDPRLSISNSGTLEKVRKFSPKISECATLLLQAQRQFLEIERAKKWIEEERKRLQADEQREVQLEAFNAKYEALKHRHAALFSGT